MTHRLTLSVAASTQMALVLLVGSLHAQPQPYLVRTIAGPTPQPFELGWAAADAGDVDLDGKSDILLGCPYAPHDHPASFVHAGSWGVSSYAGQVRLISGATGAIIRIIQSPQAGGLFGYSVAGIGDVNNDGIPDAAVGEPLRNVGGNVHAGRVTVWSGASGALLWTFSGTVLQHGVGCALSRVGDLDLDGMDDVVVGARRWNILNPAPPGDAFVLSGATGATIHAVTGLFANDQFGAAVAGLEDLTGDGIADFAVGAPTPPCCASTNLIAPGYVQVFSGATGLPVLNLGGVDARDHFGLALASLGDVDADGLGDFAIGVSGGGDFTFPYIAGKVLVISGASGTTISTATSNAGGDWFGYSISAIEDVDGDGARDLIVGAPGTIAGPTVHIVAASSGTILASHSGALNFPTTDLGRTVLGLPDLNGDGVPEALMGAPGAGEAGVIEIKQGLTPGLHLTLQGDKGNASIGRGLAGIDDVNGDGVPDHLVGLPFLNSGGLWDSGEVRVLSGADGTVLRTHAGTAILARYGMSVATIADIDGDGVTEYAIGSATSGTTAIPMSAPVEVRSGASGMVLVTLVDPVPGGAFGWSVADAGDVDGDGTADIAVGAPYSSPGGAMIAGQAHLFSGATGALIRTLSGAAGDFFGDALVNAGDADGDGTPDLAVAAPYASIAGPQSGSVRVHSGANGNLLWSANGSAPYASMGSALANVGDIDGNGRDDLAVGSSGGGGGLTIGGKVDVFSNSGVQLLSFPGTETNDLFGAALARLGDLDGDLITELAIGRPGPHGGFGTPGRVRVVSLGSGATLFEGTSPLPPNTSSAYGANLASAGDVTGDGLDDLLVADTVVGTIPILAIGQVDVLTWAGIPTGSNLFGSGCIGSSGLQPAIRTIGGPASTAGNPHLAIHLSNAQPSSQAVLAIGGSNTAWAGGSLPFDLTAAGLPGCTLLVSLDLVFYSTVMTLAGTALVPTPIPPAPGLAGTTVHAQWLVIGPTTAAMTSGLTVVLQ